MYTRVFKQVHIKDKTLNPKSPQTSIVNNPTNIMLVNSHAESNSSNDHLQVANKSHNSGSLCNRTTPQKYPNTTKKTSNENLNRIFAIGHHLKMCSEVD